jgi:FkbM family methyltransferase
MKPWPGRRLLRVLLPKSLALRLRQEWLARHVARGTGYREGEIHLLPALVKRTDVCWDIGANIGTYTVALSQVAARILAFEPVPHNLATLRQVKRLAHLDNVEIRALAISNAAGRARLSVPTEGFYGGYYLASFDDRGELEVETASIDGLIAQGLPQPDFIKCDVEGAERLVIEGARQLLERRRPIWLLETFDPGVLPLMESFGYTAHVRTATGELAQVQQHQTQSRNYLFLPV